VLQKKAEAAFAAHYESAQAAQLTALFTNRAQLEAMLMQEFCAAFAKTS